MDGESKIIFIDVSKCIGCRACEVACEQNHDGNSFIKVHILEEIKSSIPLNCRHCEKAPCLIVCPTGAISRDWEGAVVVNPLACIGCRLCAIACPFGVPRIERELKIMIKCNLCQDRRRKGLIPLCVATCPADALFYGTLEEYSETKQETTISKLVEELRNTKGIDIAKSAHMKLQ